MVRLSLRERLLYQRAGFSVAAATAIMISWMWDVSWQATIAQDSFWTAPHLLLSLLGIVILATHIPDIIGSRSTAAAAKRDDGFSRGRSGRHLVIIGAATLLGAAVLDLWWHSARPAVTYVLTPPHVIGALGVCVTQIGALLTFVQSRDQNRASGTGRWHALGYVPVAMVLLWIVTVGTEYLARPNLWHGTEFYTVSAVVFPFVLVGVSRSIGRGWPASSSAAIYMAVTLLLIWILQAVPTGHGHFVPPPFPLALIVPAVAVDFIARRALPRPSRIRDHVRAVVLGAIIVSLLLVGHWLLADFLLSPASRGYLFAADQWPYHAPPGDWRYEFWTLNGSTTALVRGLLISLLAAMLSARLGLWLGSRYRVADVPVRRNP